jgi:hypothetical protein
MARDLRVYPMNALAEDQFGRLRSLLAGTGISFGMYVGQMPERESDVAGIRLPAGASRADHEARLAEVRREKRSETVCPPEEVCSREVMRTPGSQPRILLTNFKQLALLLTRQRDVELFAGARLDFPVFDEAGRGPRNRQTRWPCSPRRRSITSPIPAPRVNGTMSWSMSTQQCWRIRISPASPSSRTGRAFPRARSRNRAPAHQRRSRARRLLQWPAPRA